MRGLTPWEHVDLPRDGREPIRVTAVPARHGPEGAESVSGEVNGFVLTAPDLPTIYVSGDNAWLGAVEQVASRFGPVDIALLFAGAARIAGAFDGALLTLDSDLAAEAARVLDARSVVPVHYAGWQHFTEGGSSLRAAFDRAGFADRLVLLTPGESADLASWPARDCQARLAVGATALPGRKTDIAPEAWHSPTPALLRLRSGHDDLGGSTVSGRLGVPGGQYLLFFAAGEAEWRGAGCGLDLAG